MAPILCFSAQDVADELVRLTGKPFDVHASVRGELTPPMARGSGTPTSAGPTRSARAARRCSASWRAFRAAGHKSLEARVRVTPAAAERPHWQWNLDHLAELCVVSRVELDPTDAAAGAETSVVVEEAPWPDCPRCWRRTGDAPTPAAARSQPVPALRRRRRRRHVAGPRSDS